MTRAQRAAISGRGAVGSELEPLRGCGHLQAAESAPGSRSSGVACLSARPLDGRRCRPAPAPVSPTPRATSSVKSPTRCPMTTGVPGDARAGTDGAHLPEIELATMREGWLSTVITRPSDVKNDETPGGAMEPGEEPSSHAWTSGVFRRAEPILTLNQVTNIDAPPQRDPAQHPRRASSFELRRPMSPRPRSRPRRSLVWHPRFPTVVALGSGRLPAHRAG